MATLEELWRKGQLPNTERYVENLSLAIKKQYESRIDETHPHWWARMALSDRSPDAGGGILIRKTSTGMQVYYANKGKYNYLSVIENGRGRYSIKEALLRSPRAKTGKKGRYIIIPMKGKKEEAVGTIKRTGTRLDASGVRRSTYKYSDKKGRGSTYRAAQETKGGKTQYSYVKFVCVSENSTGWIHPAIPPNPIAKELQKDTDRILQTDKRLTDAMVKDIETMFQGMA